MPDKQKGGQDVLLLLKVYKPLTQFVFTIFFWLIRLPDLSDIRIK